ncbi:selenocysteine insertion sequence-binding protein 2 [Drosophila eugracilis]|uniref:selenocysteine insertion sequence-binding protein 2 n=1 Tax=Drosophila eugracilis TaxID=29029 RepID=UPI0007E5F511|nr:selenocysteine insertion sequence-binding protein 2 [Drosophila eugracilis]
MSRNSDKINLIDQKAYSKLRDDKDTAPKNTPRSSKYKYKHRKPEQQTSLLDFVVKPRPKTQRQIKVRKLHKPHLTTTRNNYIQGIKRKGKTRLKPKKKITKLKRSVRCYRTVKKEESAVTEKKNDAAPKDCSKFPLKVYSVELQVERLSLIEPPTSIESSHAKEIHSIHSRRFRSYCDNCTRPRLKELVKHLLQELDRFQKRAFAKNEIKARAHPRMVLGFREAVARLRINKVKLLLLATDCESCPGEYGLDKTIESLKFQCQQEKVPYCFPLVRRELSHTLQKRAQISCVAILDCDGVNATYADLLKEIEDARAEYKLRTAL